MKLMYEYDSKQQKMQGKMQGKKQGKKHSEKHGSLIANRTFRIVIVIAALLLLGLITILRMIFALDKEEQDTTQVAGQADTQETTDPDSEQDGQQHEALQVEEYEQDGVQYRKETYRWFDIEIPVKDVENKEKELLTTMSLGGGGGNVGHSKLNDQSVVAMYYYNLPALFTDDQITSITYSLYNCCGVLNGVCDGSYAMYHTFQHFKPQKVTVPFEEQALTLTMYLDFNQTTVTYEDNLPSNADMKLVQHDILENALLQADVLYHDGTIETYYISMVLPSKYNTSSVSFYRVYLE